MPAPAAASEAAASLNRPTRRSAQSASQASTPKTQRNGDPQARTRTQPSRQLYEEFLGEPLSHKCHELLHTTYTPRATKTAKAEEAKKVKVE